jgi:DNA-binding transcriptional ArsR family regulator
MTTPRFDDLIHAPTRLSIVSLLAASDWAEFRFIRDTVVLSDSALSKQLTVLEEAGYIEIRKAFLGKRPRTWARLSKAGRVAFQGHVARLREIVNQAGVTLDPTQVNDSLADSPEGPGETMTLSPAAEIRATARAAELAER